MPTYEYRCLACCRDFERFQKMSDPPRASCPGCGQIAERLISAGAGLLFKGDGFYITDYRSDEYKRVAKQEAGDGKATNAKAGNGRDPKAVAAPSSADGKTGKPAKEGASSGAPAAGSERSGRTRGGGR